MVSFGLPFITKDIPTIWWANFVAVAGCYAYAFAVKGKSGPGEGERELLPPAVAQIIKALDYGSGRERGRRN